MNIRIGKLVIEVTSMYTDCSSEAVGIIEPIFAKAKVPKAYRKAKNSNKGKR
jgi:hypothetical protein